MSTGTAQDDRRVVTVALLTPYLWETMEQCQEACGKEGAKDQIKDFGFDPNNFNGKKFLKTENFMVKIETPDDHNMKSQTDADLIIIGNTEKSEEAVSQCMGRGVIFCRYSIFYPGPSRYTGTTPGDAGYSIDLPKDVSTAKALLTNDLFLEAILARDEGMIQTALISLNADLPSPVLATPFLSQALAIQR